MTRRLLAAVVLIALSAAIVHADGPTLRLPNVFSDTMVLQRDLPTDIWGTDAPDAKVTVAFAGQEQTTITGKDGKWRVTLKPLKTSKTPRTLSVSSSIGNRKLAIGNVLVGEVWLASGQSNMEWSLRGSQGAQAAIADADIPNIRLLHVPRTQVAAPAADIKSTWKVCTPQTVPNFSGVAYFFGRRLNHELDVPVGLINASWGGSRIEPWTPEEGYTLVKAFAEKGGANGAMYNGMVAPLRGFAVRGAIWYQGESNVGNGAIYHERMLALIRGWRKVLKRKDMPFYFVHLGPFRGYAATLPVVWEAQARVLAEPNTGMAVITDLVPNVGDIHPRNKLDVGERLALWALAKDYGKKTLVYSGPLYKSMAVKGKTIVLSFEHVGGSLKSRDDKPLTHFEIAGKDGKFVPAVATIAKPGFLSSTSKKVIVSAEAVTKPTAARFGWSGVANPNLCNTEGLPAIPFRTNAPE